MAGVKLLLVSDLYQSGIACIAMALDLPLTTVEDFMPRQAMSGSQIETALKLHRRLARTGRTIDLSPNDIAIVGFNCRWIFVHKGTVYDPMGWKVSFQTLLGQGYINILLTPEE